MVDRVDLGVDDLSAAHWELTEAEQGLQVRLGEYETGGWGRGVGGSKDGGKGRTRTFSQWVDFVRLT